MANGKVLQAISQSDGMGIKMTLAALSSPPETKRAPKLAGVRMA